MNTPSKTVNNFLTLSPKSFLAKELRKAIEKNDISGNDLIFRTSGKIAPDASNSNLRKLMKRVNSNLFFVGGKRRWASEGYKLGVVKRICQTAEQNKTNSI